MPDLNRYLQTAFPRLVLKPNLYEQWPYGLHFEFAKGLYQLKDGVEKFNPVYFQQVYKEATTLFQEIFSEQDTLFLVTNVYQRKSGERKGKRKLKVYSHYVVDKRVRSRLTQTTFPYSFVDEEDEDVQTTQFSLRCQKQDVNVPMLLRAICHQDFPSLQLRLHNPYRLQAPDIFFINVTKDMIFYIYDDRGCEVIANDAEPLRSLYRKCTAWIDENEREEIVRKLGIDA